MSATQHVVLALTLTAILFVIAGDSWNSRISAIHPVKAAPKT